MGIIKRRVPYFATGLLIGTILSVILLTFWYKNRKNAEPVAMPVRELRVPPVGAWAINLKLNPGWKILLEDSFVREVVGEKLGDPRALTAEDLKHGLLFTEEQGVGQVVVSHSIQLGLMVCKESDSKICRAESHDLRVVSDPRGTVAFDISVGEAETAVNSQLSQEAVKFPEEWLACAKDDDCVQVYYGCGSRAVVNATFREPATKQAYSAGGDPKTLDCHEPSGKKPQALSPKCDQKRCGLVAEIQKN